MHIRFLYLNVNQGLGKEETVVREKSWVDYAPMFGKFLKKWSFLDPKQDPTHECIDRLIEHLKEYQEKRVFVASEVMKLCWLTGKNLVERIAVGAGFPYVAYGRSFQAEYLPRWKGKLPPQFDGGNAIFSDIPLDNVVVGSFPSDMPLTRLACKFVGERTFVMARINHSSGSLYVIGTHLSQLKDYERELAAKRLVSIAKQVQGPLVLMVDANAVPCYVPKKLRYVNDGVDGLCDDYLRDKTLHLLRESFVDTCPISAFDDTTTLVEKFPTFEKRRIDYVLTKDLPATESYIVRPENFSDHQMIDCVLNIPSVDARCDNIGELVIRPSVTIPNKVAYVARTLFEAGKNIRNGIGTILGK